MRAPGSTEPNDPTLGQLARDRYRLQSRLAVGGFKRVWKALDEITGNTVAFSVLQYVGVDAEDTAEMRARFRAEAITLAALPKDLAPELRPFLSAVATFEDFGEIHLGGELDGMYLVTRFIEGETLEQILEGEQVLPWQDAVEIAAGVLEALMVAHSSTPSRRPILHRDIKPGNVVIDRESGRVTVLDFGLAKVVSETSGLQSMVAGTVAYMPFEQAAEGTVVDVRTDLYAVGVLLYQMITGALPFERRTLAEIGRDYLAFLAGKITPPAPFPEDLGVPAAVESVVMQALSPTLDGRPRSAVEMRRRLLEGAVAESNFEERTVVDLRPRAERPTKSATEPATMASTRASPQPRSRTWLLVVAAASLFIVGGLLLASRGDRRAPIAVVVPRAPEPVVVRDAHVGPELVASVDVDAGRADAELSGKGPDAFVQRRTKPVMAEERLEPAPTELERARAVPLDVLDASSERTRSAGREQPLEQPGDAAGVPEPAPSSVVDAGSPRPAEPAPSNTEARKREQGARLGTLTVSTSVEVGVEVDGKSIGTCPAALTVRSSPVRVVLYGPNVEGTVTLLVSVQEGGIGVTADANPWSFIKHNGISVGKTPQTVEAASKHRIALFRPGQRAPLVISLLWSPKN